MSQKTKNLEFSMEEILDYEKIRYERKGYGLIFAIIFTVSWFCLAPNLLHYVWPYKFSDPGQFTSIISYVVHGGTFIVANFMMWIIYKLEWNFFERYKTHDKPWPWHSDPERWNVLIKDTMVTLFINQVIILPLFVLFNYLVGDRTPFRYKYDSLPSSFEVIWQTTFFMFVEDFTFYWTHRFFHWDRIYPYIHKKHHKYVNTVSISSEYAHPVEYVISNVLPSNIGPFLLGQRVHLATVLMWLVLRVGETTDGHCGYEFSWSPYRLLPMSGSSEYHNYHHLNFKGNYGSFFTIWDRVFKTVNQRYILFSQKKKELHLKHAENNRRGQKFD